MAFDCGNTVPLPLSSNYTNLLVYLQEYQGSKEGHEKVMLQIERQALVQVLIRECARALASSKGREVSYYLVTLQISIGNHMGFECNLGNNCTSNRQSNCTSDSECNL